MMDETELFETPNKPLRRKLIHSFESFDSDRDFGAGSGIFFLIICFIYFIKQYKTSKHWESTVIKQNNYSNLFFFFFWNSSSSV